MIEVLVNFKSKLLTHAFCEVLKTIEGFVPCLSGDEKCKNPTIVLIDYFSLSKEISLMYPKAKVVFIDTGLEEKSLLKVLTQYKLAGIIAPYTDMELFEKALRKVSEGQIWLDNRYLKHLIGNDERISPQFSPGEVSLTPKEKGIVHWVCEGLANKEIAVKLKISEQTVKSHLYKVFKKVGVSSRTQLINIFLGTELV